MLMLSKITSKASKGLGKSNSLSLIFLEQFNSSENYVVENTNGLVGISHQV